MIEQAVKGKITNRQAAEVLDLSERQVIRLKERIEAEGVTGLAHKKNRERTPQHAVPNCWRSADTLPTGTGIKIKRFSKNSERYGLPNIGISFQYDVCLFGGGTSSTFAYWQIFLSHIRSPLSCHLPPPEV
ncbi:hypothetical protein MGLY_06740 [Neomoorella glycerini]|uniref:Uncharacterized protein n=1 Tax=Neomoorella glycerini TaxID=55779 RepID=A0A6I5ZNB4_9FIRM|nr:helix-turn-helix domain-containing protein [Moorella glycerini]QGP91343.1 hypothetical protein MGLY_06740 [Moorella glycerini]